MIIKCPYCGQQATLTRARDLPSSVVGKLSWTRQNNAYLWHCTRCDAWVMAKRNLKPMGQLANKELREFRYRLHLKLDKIWQGGKLTRKQVYGLLAQKMKMSDKRCHIGNFNMKQCRKAEKAIVEIENYVRKCC